MPVAAADEVGEPTQNTPARHAIPPENLAALPAAAGVYLFFGAAQALAAETSGGPGRRRRKATVKTEPPLVPAALAWPELPLYIGKSVNIRARVLSHIREPAEARMMRQVQRVEWVRTAGEIGALLLESRWIKTRQPLYNKLLRRSRELCAWQFQPALGQTRPTLAFSREVEFATAQGLYGLYASAHAAQDALRELAQAQHLCLSTLGLEAPSRRGCFGRQIGRCAGVCVGQEAASDHAQRVLAALQGSQVQQWPFEGAVGVVERDGDWSQTHVVQHWRHLHTLESHAGSAPRLAWQADGADALAPSLHPAGFDLDAYRILMRPLMTGQAEVVPLHGL